MVGELEKFLFNFDEWTKSDDGNNFLSKFGSGEDASLHLFGGVGYLIFRKSNVFNDWGCAGSFLRGFEENVEYLPKYLEKCSPAHVICFQKGVHLDGISSLLTKEPDFNTHTQHFGEAYVFLNAHREL